MTSPDLQHLQTFHTKKYNIINQFNLEWRNCDSMTLNCRASIDVTLTAQACLQVSLSAPLSFDVSRSLWYSIDITFTIKWVASFKLSLVLKNFFTIYANVITKLNWKLFTKVIRAKQRSSGLHDRESYAEKRKPLI